MVAMVLGLVLIIIAALSMHYEQLIQSLASEDKQQWEILGAPKKQGFNNLLWANISVHSWVLSKAFEESLSENVRALGRASYNRALFCKYAFIAGALMLAIGFVLFLFPSPLHA